MLLVFTNQPLGRPTIDLMTPYSHLYLARHVIDAPVS